MIQKRSSKGRTREQILLETVETGRFPPRYVHRFRFFISLRIHEESLSQVMGLFKLVIENPSEMHERETKICDTTRLLHDYVSYTGDKRSRGSWARDSSEDVMSGACSLNSWIGPKVSAFASSCSHGSKRSSVSVSEINPSQSASNCCESVSVSEGSVLRL